MWPRSSKRAGVTLAEILVYSFLMLLVLTAINGVFTLCLRYYLPTFDFVDTQQRAMIAASRVARELSNAAYSSVSPDTTNNGVVFVSAAPTSGSSNASFAFTFDTNSPYAVKWQKYVCFYTDTLNGENVLFRKENASPSPTPSPSALPSSTLPTTTYSVSSIKTDTSWTRSTVSEDIVSFQCGFNETTNQTAESDSVVLNGKTFTIVVTAQDSNGNIVNVQTAVSFHQ